VRAPAVATCVREASSHRPRLGTDAAIGDRIRALEAALTALRREQRDALVIALAAVVDGPFTAGELVAASLRDPDLAMALATDNPRKVGKLLQALVGHPVGPYTLARSKRETGGRAWVLLVTKD
jgi:hypothetical protein